MVIVCFCPIQILYTTCIHAAPNRLNNVDSVCHSYIAQMVWSYQGFQGFEEKALSKCAYGS